MGFGNELFKAASSGQYGLLPGKNVLIDNLGNTVEASVNAVDYFGNPDPRNRKFYGNFHNDGHIHFMLFDNTPPYGVMAATTTAIRDPIFFRWHKLIDNVSFRYQQSLPANDFSHGPNVTIRKDTRPGAAASVDIILAREKDMPASIEGHKFGSRAYEQRAVAAFGYSADPKLDRWSQDFSLAKATLATGEATQTTDELLTEMLTRTINLTEADGGPATETVEYLSHEDFFYFIRVQNDLADPQTVAVRIFLAPEEEVEDRRIWIELDRFACKLKGKECAVIFRPADQSSVIRKPALRPDDITADDGASRAREAQPWCDCGWPYTVLLPRGTRDGMKFRLLVMFSSGDDLIMPDHPECCTSISYCGLQNLEYPDKTPMGYPFDRDFQPSVTKTVESFRNWAWRTIKIRCRNL